MMKTGELNLSVAVRIIKSIFADASSNDIGTNKAACCTEKKQCII